MTMQSEIRRQIENTLNIDISDISDHINNTVSFMEDKMSEIEEVIRSAVEDLDSPVLIDDVKETLTKLAEDI